MLLLIDNYDSFVFNLARYFAELGCETEVVRNDRISVAEIAERAPEAVVLSPGPCAPAQAGICLDLVRQLHSTIPMLGVCLGHQVIAEAFGGRVIRAPEPVHGRCSPIIHDQKQLFESMPSPLTVTRYHSLIAEEASLPECLSVSARTPDGIIMAFQHRRYPIYGVQFHPESVLTEGGHRLLWNFLHCTGIGVLAECPATRAEWSSPTELECAPAALSQPLHW